MKKQIVVVLEGGLVSAIVANEPIPDIEVAVIDYDDYGVYNYDKEDIIHVPQHSPHEKGKFHYAADATGHIVEVTKAGIDIQSVITQLKERDERWQNK